MARWYINAKDAMQSGSKTGGVADFWTERTRGRYDSDVNEHKVLGVANVCGIQ